MKESQKRLLGGKVDKLACTPGDGQSITAGGAGENVPGEARAWLHELSLPWLKYQSLSHVQLFATPWTVAHQPLLSMGFPRQEY